MPETPVSENLAHILVVDDNAMNREVLIRRLVKKDYRVSEVASGVEALQQLKNHRYDLVLLDWMMPEMDGISVLKVIRESYSMIALPVIMVTAQEQSEAIIEALYAGANDYVPKPLDMPVLMARIETQLAWKQAEDALLQSEAHYRTLFDSTSDIILIFTTQGEIHFANTAARLKLGLPTPLSQTHWQQYVPLEYHPQFQGQFDKVCAGGDCLPLETSLQTSTGQILMVEGNMNHYLQPNGVLEIQGIFRDVSERKRVERMKDEFVATVSHELRTPLTAIHGSLKLLTQGIMGSFDEDVMGLLQVAESNTERLMILINDILDMSKIEAGKMDYTLLPLDLVPLLNRAIAENQPYADKYQVQLQLQEPKGSCWVKADETRLLQVMANLLSNAAKFSPPESTVHIQLISTPEHAKVSVSDQGAGIPDDAHALIFQKFSQVDSSSTRKKGGTGLGLSISKAIIENHQGEIGFESDVNQGSVFYFSLPLYQEGSA